MDNHPIPQDVTGFQFRLIGDMTVKQFAYVAIGGILTIVFLYVPIPFLLRIPFMLFFAGAGAAMAFLPIEGRPVDVMVGNFIKALITPNQYAYHKKGGHLPIFGYQSRPQPLQITQTVKPVQTPAAKSEDRERQLQNYLATLHSQNLSPLEKRELEFTQRLFGQTTPQPAPPPEKSAGLSIPMPKITFPIHVPEHIRPVEKPAVPQVPQPPPSQQTPEEKNKTLALQENVLSQELSHAKQDESSATDVVKRQEAHTHVTELELQIAQIQSQKDALEKQLTALRSQAATQSTQQQTAQTANPEPQSHLVMPAEPQTPVVPPSPPGITVRKIPAEMAKSLGLPHLPDVPNLILGIVKDPRGNALSNILVEVKDKDGTPARAFRTNQLGQFASATQLSTGTYTIEFEDPKGAHRFDTIEIQANNEILMPIEVISHDEREELRKALFN